jgi:hypothetical protein
MCPSVIYIHIHTHTYICVCVCARACLRDCGQSELRKGEEREIGMYLLLCPSWKDAMELMEVKR